MITSIIFSKDRPLQLDLCLRSIKENIPDSTQNIVIYNNSEEFDGAYNTLKNEHPNVEFWPQGASLFKDIYHAAQATQNNYICFFTDDIICYRPMGNIDYNILLDPRMSCISLRMGTNITERSCDGQAYIDVPPEVFPLGDNMIAWCRTNSLYGSYWSYNLSVDGHIFRKNDIFEILSELTYLEPIKKWKQTPNEFESAIQRFWTLTPNFMSSPLHSIIVNSPNNRVQQSHDENRSGDMHDYDAKCLLDKYVSGSRINLDKLDFVDIKCPHTEIDLMKGLV